ncbi:PTS sugar transporter subunit IIC [Oscillospiraceae bacterium NTUH-002-81]|nr:PTS sugar transporter subunit IIC [Oscillospiraceae bacterium NTUH-002-81]
MEKVKKALNHVFIDGLSGMALGLFATLIIGTIIQQIGNLIGGTVGDTLYLFGKAASVMTSAGIGVGVAYKFKEPVYVTLSAATAGMIGGYASKILAGTLIGEGGVVVLAGPGEPLGAFIAAIVGIELGHLVAGKTKIDLLVTPFVTIVTGSTVGLLVGPPITRFMTGLGAIINWGTEQQPFLMGIVVSVLMGMILTLPISSAALGIILNLSGLAAGAAVVGCCCNMVGFAVASYRENKIGGLLAQGVGTSMLQVPNIVRKPVIWLPAIISSAILGPVSTLVFHMTSNATGSGMGTAGLVGQIMTYQVMTETLPAVVVLAEIALMHFLLPAAISLAVSEVMRKKAWIKFGDMKLDVA